MSTCTRLPGYEPANPSLKLPNQQRGIAQNNTSPALLQYKDYPTCNTCSAKDIIVNEEIMSLFVDLHGSTNRSSLASLTVS
jgi:hypothetical protein